MSYKALYRTYRPQTFKDVTGQDVVVQTLQNAIKNNKISHAYLFCGPRGTGKTSIARIFAKALNCSNLNVNEPCDECISCKEISQGINPDVIEIDAASNNGVDEIRDIREKVKYLPSGSKYKIYIIDEVHMLSGGAFNALLKTLEEPPKHVVFILATTEPQKLPATIVSRCQRYEFKSLSVEEISTRLKEICELEDVNISEEALNSISESAEGAMRDALSILDQAISYGNKNIEIDDINGVTGSLNFEKVIALGNAVENKDIHNTLEIVHGLLSTGKEISKIINGLLVFYRDVLLYKSVGDSGYSKYIFEKEEFKEFSNHVNVSKIMYLIDILCDIQSKVKYSTTPNIFLEIALIKMCNVTLEDLDIMKRVSELENKLNNIGNISNIEIPSEGISVDNEKVNNLEVRINQIVNELNRLELRKQIEKIDELKVAVSNINISSNNSSLDREIQSELSHLKDKIDELDLFVNKEETSSNEELLEKINELEQKISNGVTVASNNKVNIDNEFINKLQVLEEKVANINNNVNNDSSTECNDFSDILDELKARLDELDNKENSEKGATVDLSDIYIRLNELESQEEKEQVVSYDEEKISEIEENILSIKDDIDQIKEKIIERENYHYESSDNASDMSEISEKIMFLERRLYQIVAGELSAKKSNKKEPKKNNGQIMLFGDEILSVADLEENNKEKIDFDEIQREEPLVVVKEEVKEENSETKLETKQEFIETKEEFVSPVIANEEKEVPLFETENIIPEIKEVKPVSPVQSSYFDMENNTKVLIKENSTMVITKKEDNKLDIESVVKPDVRLEFNTEIVDETKVEEQTDMFNADVITKENAVVTNESQDSEKDKFASYNIKFIEQILHDSRSIEARNDKVRIEQVWKNMTRGARPEALSIIETLQTGMVAVVGNKEFIIAFPNVGLCNIVMRPKFKTSAVRVLYNLLGETYNYVALPTDAWSKVSSEYKGQYQMGNKYPTLKPLNIPGLEVIKDEYETDTEKIINRTLKLFGEGNVKIEE